MTHTPAAAPARAPEPVPPSPLVDPDRFCIDCCHAWVVIEELCPACGFDPVHDASDADRNEEARAVSLAARRA